MRILFLAIITGVIIGWPAFNAGTVFGEKHALLSRYDLVVWRDRGSQEIRYMSEGDPTELADELDATSIRLRKAIARAAPAPRS